jgi:PAS domain S-box-containing protein
MNTDESFEWTSMVVGVASIAVGAIRLLSYAAALSPFTGIPRVDSPPSAWATASIVLLGYGLIGLSRRPDSLAVRLTVVGAALLAVLAPFGSVLMYQSPSLAAKLGELRASGPVGAIAILLASASLLARTISRERFVAGLLGVTVLTIGFVASLGYIYGGPLVMGLGWAPIKLTSALATLLVGVGLVTVGGPTAWPNRLFVGSSVHTMMLRWLVPLMTVAIVVSGIADADVFSHSSRAIGSALNTIVSVAVTLFVVSYLGRLIGGRIEQTEQHVTRIFRSVPAGLTISDIDDGTFIEVNDAFERVFGIPRADAIGKRLADLGVWADPSDGPDFSLRLAAAGGELRDEELNMRTRDGRPIVIRIDAEVVDFRGQRALLTSFIDVTEQRTAEREARAELTERRRRTITSGASAPHVRPWPG